MSIVHKYVWTYLMQWKPSTMRIWSIEIAIYVSNTTIEPPNCYYRFIGWSHRTDSNRSNQFIIIIAFFLKSDRIWSYGIVKAVFFPVYSVYSPSISAWCCYSICLILVIGDNIHSMVWYGMVYGIVRWKHIPNRQLWNVFCLFFLSWQPTD